MTRSKSMNTSASVNERVSTKYGSVMVFREPFSLVFS